jgi:hypothetical protein
MESKYIVSLTQKVYQLSLNFNLSYLLKNIYENFVGYKNLECFEPLSHDF